MSNENNAIHGFDVNLICDFFLNTERQGPGSPEVTIKALSFIDNLTDESRFDVVSRSGGGYLRFEPSMIFWTLSMNSFGADAPCMRPSSSPCVSKTR